MRLLATFCFVAVLPMAAQHEQDGEKAKHPEIFDPVVIAAGHKIFSDGCAACHGAEGEGGRGPNLKDSVFWHPLNEETIYKAVKNGIAGGGMPPANLPEPELWKVVAFVRSLTTPAIEINVAGDAQAGEAVFWGKGGCGSCHRIKGRGGQLGPDLTNVAAVRPEPRIRQAIVDPDAGGARGYQGVTAVLKNGKKLAGVARNRTNYDLQLQDAQGNLHLLSMADVGELTLTKGSPMPKDFAQKLSAPEIDNLVAFLSRQSLRSREEVKEAEKKAAMDR